MSLLKPQEFVEEGDVVILYLGVNSMHCIEAKSKTINKKGCTIENIFQTSFGSLKVGSIIGVPYGSRLELSKGYAHILQTNPELWTQTIPHRTQIIYTPDISMIILQLELHPGSIVIESGTGSGSLSHYFLRRVKPHGHLHTFDFHEARCAQVREEFNRHGLGKYVTVYHRDVCQNGFCDELENKADAVFLDLPAPHLAVSHAVKTLKREGGRFCSFSPCIEQSQRCCNALEDNGFTNIQSLEILQRKDTIVTKPWPLIDIQYLRHKKKTCVDSGIEEIRSSTKNLNSKTFKESKKVTTSTTPICAAGHTGYLTFATLPPNFE